MGQEEQATEVLDALLKEVKEKNSIPASGSKGKAAARGKGGRQALLKKVQQGQVSTLPGDEVDSLSPPVPTKTETVAALSPRVFDDDVINVLQFALKGLGKCEC
jgi:hypothetical protein